MEKKLLLGVVVVICLLGSAALALDPMGPPTAERGKGGWGFGAEYSYSGVTIERKLSYTSSSAKPTIDTTVNKVYANIGYGVSDNVDAFVRLGAATLEWERVPSRNYAFKGGDGDLGFVWGGGIKMTLRNSGDISWGLLGQFSRSELRGGMKTGDGDRGKYWLDFNEMQIAAGPTWQAGQGFKIYGGPFLHFVDGTMKEQSNSLSDSDPHQKSIKEESWFGGYIGTEIELAKNTNVTVEGQFTDNGWAVACGIVFTK